MPVCARNAYKKSGLGRFFNGASELAAGAVLAGIYWP
jgi:hypothetical protein